MTPPRTLTDLAAVSAYIDWCAEVGGGVPPDEARRLVDEVERIKAAVQEHHDQTGDNRCWLDDIKLYHAVLDEGVDPYVGALPPDDDMLESCRRYIRQRRYPGITGIVPLPDDMTIAQLTAEIRHLNLEKERLGRALDVEIKKRLSLEAHR
jgi:hypothetical protein